MPRYFFHVRDGGGFLPDEQGLNVTGAQAARIEAIRAAGEMLRDLAEDFSGDEWRMEVTDEAGATVLTLRFFATGGLN